jgi:mono/diheme cytochrome c family protein
MSEADAAASSHPPHCRLVSALRVGTMAGIMGLGLALGACGASESEPPLTGELAEGQALYRSTCLECHGERALGDGPLASTLPIRPPSLLEHLAHHTRAQLVQLIRAGIPPAMPAPPLSDEQVQLVIDYVWTLVPADQVDALREMQSHVEMGHMPGITMPAGMPVDSGQAAMPMHH